MKNAILMGITASLLAHFTEYYYATWQFWVILTPAIIAAVTSD